MFKPLPCVVTWVFMLRTGGSREQVAAGWLYHRFFEGTSLGALRKLWNQPFRRYPKRSDDDLLRVEMAVNAQKEATERLDLSVSVLTSTLADILDIVSPIPQDDVRPVSTDELIKVAGPPPLLTARPGDKVRLRSGGPPMFVRKSAYGHAVCDWFESGSLRSREFPVACLTRYFGPDEPEDSEEVT